MTTIRNLPCQIENEGSEIRFKTQLAISSIMQGGSVSKLSEFSPYVSCICKL